MSGEQRAGSVGIPAVIGIIFGVMGFFGSCTSIAVAGATGVQLFTRTEVRAEETERKLAKVEALATSTAEHFNGPARAEHQKLVGRVDLLDAEVKTKANHEAMQSLASEMRQNFTHVIGLLNEVREDRKHKDRP